MNNTQNIRKWFIYKIVSPTGKIYIGKTCRIKERKAHYRCASNCLSQQRVVINSLRKYGFDNHLFEIIDEFYSGNDYASGKEMFWIRSFMSNRSKWPNEEGMNLTDGGEGVFGAKFHNRQSNFKGKTWSDEHKKRIGLSKIGNTYTKGIKLSEETRKKISISSCTLKGKPIIQLDSNGRFIKEYPAIRVASKETGIDRGVIRNSLLGVKTKSINYKFHYKCHS